MPTAADLVVKKNDGNTNVTYSIVTASGGDRSPAIFRNNAYSTIAKNRPRLSIEARANTTGAARRITTEFAYPVLATVNGVETIIGSIPISVSMACPQNISDVELAEAVAQWANLHSTALVKSCLSAGYSAT